MSPSAKAPSGPATTSLVVEFNYELETKGTNRFKESGVPEGQRGAIGTLYITKTALARLKNTKRLRVTIEGIG